VGVGSGPPPSAETDGTDDNNKKDKTDEADRTAETEKKDQTGPPDKTKTRPDEQDHDVKNEPKNKAVEQRNSTAPRPVPGTGRHAVGVAYWWIHRRR
jgi:hypothetical protein